MAAVVRHRMRLLSESCLSCRSRHPVYCQGARADEGAASERGDAGDREEKSDAAAARESGPRAAAVPTNFATVNSDNVSVSQNTLTV